MLIMASYGQHGSQWVKQNSEMLASYCLMNMALLCLTSTFSCLGKFVAWFKHVPTDCPSSVWDVIIQRG